MPRTAICLWVLLLAAAAPGLTSAADPVARGDAAWSRRADGHRGWRAAPGPIASAIEAYREAVDAEPQRLEAYWKLLRALYFQGRFVFEERQARKAVFDRGRQVAEAALDVLGQRVGGRAALDEMTPEEVAEALATVPEAAPIYFWSAVDWGLWGDNVGKLAAARRGVAKRLRDYSRKVIALDETYEGAGGHRLLGRLHAEAPRIPFVTGWVDRDTAVSELRRAVELAPREPYNVLYLAEARAEFVPEETEEAIASLKAMLARLPDPAEPVETAKIESEIRALLAEIE